MYFFESVEIRSGVAEKPRVHLLILKTMTEWRYKIIIMATSAATIIIKTYKRALGGAHTSAEDCHVL